MTRPSNETKELLAVAFEAAKAGAAVVRDAAPRRDIKVQAKGSKDFVTEVDLASEAAILGLVRRALPEAKILAEESAADVAAAKLDQGVTFVIDPLDGTTNFIHGYPEYAVSVGVVKDGELVAGVVVDVPLKEVFTATRGGGAFLNNKKIVVSAVDEPSNALVGAGFPFRNPERLAAFPALLGRVMRGTAGVRRAGSAALDLASVACGRFDAFWELMLSPWDIAAGLLLVREAGGVATDLGGRPCPVAKTGVVAGNRAMHGWLLRTLNDQNE